MPSLPMKLRRSNIPRIILVVLILVLISLGVALIAREVQSRTTVKVGDGVFNAKVVSSPDELRRGLSGTKDLSASEGMLFVFSQDAPWSIWMKDMKFPIDIIWLDADKRVVYIVKGAHPDGYPRERFMPKSNARYVFEVPAGTVDSRTIKIGDEATFDLPNKSQWLPWR